jgi:hypothetical protein
MNPSNKLSPFICEAASAALPAITTRILVYVVFASLGLSLQGADQQTHTSAPEKILDWNDAKWWEGRKGSGTSMARSNSVANGQTNETANRLLPLPQRNEERRIVGDNHFLPTEMIFRQSDEWSANERRTIREFRRAPFENHFTLLPHSRTGRVR